MTNPCRVNGVDYPSQAEAAAAQGVSPATIGRWIRKGKNARRLGPRKFLIEVEIHGNWYESARAAARAHGHDPDVFYQWVYRRVKRGVYEDRHWTLGIVKMRDKK